MKKTIVLASCLMLVMVCQAFAGVVSTRTDLNTILASGSGWSAITEDFQKLDVGGSATWFGTALNKDTVIGSYGPNMIVPGIEFHSDAFNIVKAGTQPLVLPSNVLGGQLATYSFPAYGTPWLEINFLDDTNAFGFDWRTNNPYGWEHATIKVYRDATLLYNSGTITPLSGFFGYTDSGNIDRVVISSNNDDGYHVGSPLIDNLTFGVVASAPPPTGVPEPATMLLVSLGLIGLAGAKRKLGK